MVCYDPLYGATNRALRVASLAQFVQLVCDLLFFFFCQLSRFVWHARILLPWLDAAKGLMG